MRRAIAAVITAVLLAAVLLLARRPVSERDNRMDVSPEDCIERLFTAAEAGDVSVYLDCFTGDERRRLERELKDQSPGAFARSLQDALRELKGRAVFGPAESERAGQEVALTVERVYVNRTERQTYRLVREPSQWRVAGIQPTQAYQPEAAYGTPVFETPESKP